jgi:hypothetical protein
MNISAIGLPTMLLAPTTTTFWPAIGIRYLSDLEAALGERKVDAVVEGPTRKNGYIDRVARESGVLL